MISRGEDAAREIGAYIEKYGKLVKSVTPAGSLRRGKETVGDLDLLVTLAEEKKANNAKQQQAVDALAEYILKYPGIDQTLAHGENKVSFTLEDGLQVDVRLLEKENFGAALLYFTGSKEHNVALRGRANDMGWTLNEYQLATLEGEKHVASRTEEEIYGKLKLEFVPPELRENTGEIAAAEKHKLPKLIELASGFEAATHERAKNLPKFTPTIPDDHIAGEPLNITHGNSGKSEKPQERRQHHM